MAVAAVGRVDHPGAHAQSEVIIVEEAAAATLDGDDPYAAEYRNGPLSARPEATQIVGELVAGDRRRMDARNVAPNRRHRTDLFSPAKHFTCRIMLTFVLTQ